MLSARTDASNAGSARAVDDEEEGGNGEETIEQKKGHEKEADKDEEEEGAMSAVAIFRKGATLAEAWAQLIIRNANA